MMRAVTILPAALLREFSEELSRTGSTVPAGIEVCPNASEAESRKITAMNFIPSSRVDAARLQMMVLPVLERGVGFLVSRRATTEGGLLKSWRPLIHNTERGFEREPCASQPSFLKKLADQGDTMRHAPRRRKSRQRMIRIGGPVASRLGDLHEPGPERE